MKKFELKIRTRPNRTRLRPLSRLRSVVHFSSLKCSPTQSSDKISRDPRSQNYLFVIKNLTIASHTSHAPNCLVSNCFIIVNIAFIHVICLILFLSFGHHRLGWVDGEERKLKSAQQDGNQVLQNHKHAVQDDSVDEPGKGHDESHQNQREWKTFSRLAVYHFFEAQHGESNQHVQNRCQEESKTLLDDCWVFVLRKNEKIEFQVDLVTGFLLSTWVLARQLEFGMSINSCK